MSTQTKGEQNGICNRIACNNTGASHFNNVTRKYYCTPCARRINESARQSGMGPIYDWPDPTPATPSLQSVAEAAAKELNRAFNLYAWEDSQAEAESILIRHFAPLEQRIKELEGGLPDCLSPSKHYMNDRLFCTSVRHFDKIYATYYGFEPPSPLCGIGLSRFPGMWAPCPCPNDTNGDGDCRRCHQHGGCFMGGAS